MSDVRPVRLGGTVGRLVAEFFVIVVGVLVALAVDGLASANEERERVATYIAQLETELDEMSEKLVVEHQRYEEAVGYAARLVQGLQNAETAAPDSLARMMFESVIGVEWEPEATVINTMISSGDIVLVRDRTLQAAMVRFTERVEASRYRRGLGEELFLDGFRMIQLRADMFRWAPWILGTPDIGQRWDWGRLADDLAFRNGIFGMANGLRNHRAALGILEGDIQALQGVLAQSEGTD